MLTTRRNVPACSLLLTIMKAASILPAILFFSMSVLASGQTQFSQTFDRKVPVHLGVMSRCPDALVCEAVFDTVLPNVSDKVDLSLVYIAKLNDTDPDYGVTCKHGAGECAGNVQQLCIAKHTSFQQLWEFIHCSNSQGKDNVGKPEVTSQCAETAGFEWDGPLQDCVGEDFLGKTPEGIDLLKKSAVQVQDMGIINSCTVIINYKFVCVRDGVWRDCEGGHSAHDFTRQINEEYDLINGRL